MASRLNEDDAQGQNKWADIDDDDDDWAPEAITWGDGTKTNLHPDEHPPPESDNGSVVSKAISLDKPRSPVPPVSVGSPMVKSSGLASGKGLILKSGGQDKPTLVAKPPAPPAPVKSPWASLPPVGRASPMVESAQLARPGPYPKGMTPPPPREIAIDDFNRSAWRESVPHGNRELFNSQSGRYEPVPDRRGSMRMEQHPRHPSLLQRPPSDYPAEPSGAFQTHRISQEPPFGRRRGSSNVSGGSGTFMQRMNHSAMPPPETLAPRRPSFAGSVNGPASPNLSVSGHGLPQGHQQHQQQPGWAPRASPRDAHAVPYQVGPPPEHISGPPTLLQPAVDEVEYQKKLMRERVELARKRRQDEEAREEAERRERIQKKLDALGPAPEKHSDKKEASPKENDVSPSVQTQEREPGTSSTQSVAQLSHESTSSAASAAPREAGSKTEPKQAPLTHHSHVAATPRRTSQNQEQNPTDLWGGASSTRQERIGSSWVPAAPPTSRNVWGSPNNDRGLGNGTFITDLGRSAPDGSAASQVAKGPSPIAPPNLGQQPSHGRSQPPAPIGSRPPRYGATGSHISPGLDIASKWVNAVGENDKKMSAERLAQRAEHERQLLERGLTIDDAQPTLKDTWRPVHTPGDGTRRPVGPPGHAETQTHGAGPWRAPGEELKNAPATEDLALATNTGLIGHGPSPILSQTNKAGATPGRTSRFFPMKDRAESSVSSDFTRSKSPTPPPPTMEGHPAYEGDVMRPHVSLPKPHPVVKLPPAMTASQNLAVRSQFGWSQPQPFKDGARAPSATQRSPLSAGEATQEKWQSRINSLLSGARSPPQKSISVDVASKSALDHASHRDAATVSLPTPTTLAPQTSAKRSPVTKPMAEECFEEQEMGSLPQIRVPHKAPEAAWQPALPPTKPLPKRFTIQPSVMEPYYFPADVVGGGNALKIQFPGMAEPRVVTVPFSASRGGRGSHARPGPRHRGSAHERRGGKRDASSSRNEQSTTSASSGRGGRGSYRSRGSDSWSRAPGMTTSLPA